MQVNSSNSSSGGSPTSTTLEAVDYNLQFPTWSMEYLKKAALQQRLVRPRSLAWAVMLNAIPPPSSDIMLSIKGHRNFYNDLREKLSMDPRAVIDDDPLSQNDESAWKQHFCDNELKALILQDVVRTYPDESYFRDKDVQDMMVRVLFFWARAHPSPGYRQGMHEVLAPLLLELYSDRQQSHHHELSETLQYYLDDKYLEHDSYMLFSAVMKGLEEFYSTGDVVPTSCGRLPQTRTLHNQNEAVRYLERVREEHLFPADPELAKHLADCNISMELFGIRWLRLLFGREFPRTEIPHLWSFIFCDGPMLPNLHYIVVAMLISIRTALLECDTGGALSLLMRPSSASAGHVCALALHLRDPRRYPSPPQPHLNNSHESAIDAVNSEWSYGHNVEEEAETDGSEGVAEGGDVARSLATLALLRARLPAAVAALQAALPRPPPDAIPALEQIAQLSALLQCRNHALIDVETALEAAENQSSYVVGKRQLVPVMMLAGKKTNKKVNPVQTNQVKVINKVKEVPLQVFHQVECDSTSDLPFQDPLRLRTE
ncbi:unnamed protein product [Leptosia nina]|uniref:Rab-GAP TBC domain-containing protein n=1 Tax=Leptosia nina TaxID=320188 RepID=A0AAV1JAT4_9NEOP